MDELTKLRLLIWDKDSNVFTDEELQEFLTDTANLDGSYNVYRAAALCLNIVRANPEKLKSYSLGGLSFTYQDLDQAVKKYERMGGGTTQTISLKKVY